jgi:endoglucanase
MKMDKLTGFQIGVNLGGWLSQYKNYDHEHFKSFIEETDIQQIADWGIDHVRLPFDYPILEDDSKPFTYKDSGFNYLDQCLTWCQNHGLDLVLDLHRAPGYDFNYPDATTLFTDPGIQDRFEALWQRLAEHYLGRDQPRLIFELLNEIVLPTSDPWNQLAHRVCKTIRAIDPERWIMIGGNYYNAVSQLKEIKLVDDPRVIYTFHFYEPLPFTHQKAYWVPGLQAFDKELEYPGETIGLGDFLSKNPPYNQRLEKYVDIKMDRQYLLEELRPAINFIEETGKPLYCGEFGVIDQAPMDSTLNWYRDFIGMLKERNIGRACWTYKQLDFGLVDQDSQVINPELIDIISA